jgi:hypothetical protein
MIFIDAQLKRRRLIAAMLPILISGLKMTLPGLPEMFEACA